MQCLMIKKWQKGREKNREGFEHQRVSLWNRFSFIQLQGLVPKWCALPSISVLTWNFNALSPLALQSEKRCYIYISYLQDLFPKEIIVPEISKVWTEYCLTNIPGRFRCYYFSSSKYVSLFHAIGVFLYPLKISEN